MGFISVLDAQAGPWYSDMENGSRDEDHGIASTDVQNFQRRRCIKEKTSDMPGAE